MLYGSLRERSYSKLLTQEAARLLQGMGAEGPTPSVLAWLRGVAATALSFHLKEVVNVGQVSQERISRNLIYRADFAQMDGVLGYLAQHFCVGTGCELGPAGLLPRQRQHGLLLSRATSEHSLLKAHMSVTSISANIDVASYHIPTQQALAVTHASAHAPRILMLYGSLRERSYSKLLTLEAARLLQGMGAEVRIFNPEGLPQPDTAPAEHPKVKELRELVHWSEGMVWTTPERHGAMTGIMKSQIDWIPLSEGAVRPTQGKTLAVMQVNGGSQSFNAVNQLRILGRWMRLLTIPNQSSVAKAYDEFTEEGRMKPSAYYDRVVDVMEELMKFTLLTRDLAPYLVDRYSERKEERAKMHAQTLATM